MIDPVGTKPFAIRETRADSPKRVEPVAKAAATAPTAAPTRDVSVAAAETVRTMASKPPVDTERVVQIRRAVAEGRFPIHPATIADRLIAFEQGWRADEQG